MGSQEKVAANGAASTPDLDEVMQKYADEKNKRLAMRPEGTAQFMELKDAESKRFQALSEDPWADHTALNAQRPALKDGDRTKVLILGAGFGGLIGAVRLIETGLSADDIRLVDTAGGFGGTWYWNRYPGLHCDVEAYVYLPFLEETGYVPKTKYSSGPEIYEHSIRIAKHWNLADKALLRTEVSDVLWDEAQRSWAVNLTECRGPNEPARHLKVHAQYVLVASGVLSRPQVPKIPGLDSFGGAMFHTARWDYKTTGGAPSKTNQTEMVNLSSKRVGIIGTGATAIQAVPQLAKYAKELYVFQRTPSHVNPREQKPTDPEEWTAKIAAKPGWQDERRSNFSRSVAKAMEPDEENLVNDWWSRIESYHALVGSPRKGRVQPTPEAISEHIHDFIVLDLPCAERTRKRVDRIVKDEATAKSLKAWYPSWCKRPTFSDEYLQAFNLPNVHLVDTDGKGLDSATKTGLVFEGKEYPLDVLVLSTGYTTPARGGGSPATKTGIKVLGRNGLSLDDKFQINGVATLHGILTHDFPNFFWFGASQAGAAPNYVHMLDAQAKHIAHIVTEAESRSRSLEQKDKVLIEPSVEAEEAWSMQIMMQAAWYTTMPLCTPSYLNNEGEGANQPIDPAEAAKKARSAGWAEGMAAYEKVLEGWRAKGTLEGVQITVS